MSIKERNGILPERMERIISERGLKKSYIAEKANLTKVNFSDICAGRRLVSVMDVVNLAEALGVTPNDLILECTEKE